MKSFKFNFGKSAQGRDLEGYLFQNYAHLSVILILATVHGDEKEGLWLISHFKKLWDTDFPYSNVAAILVPRSNPDGVLLNTRTNGNGVDLNRNLPTKDWNPEAFNARYPPGPYAGSEPENQALIKLIEECNPVCILTLHSFKDPQINANGYPETQVLDWARTLLRVSPYKLITEGINDGMGYPTPGCMGTYAGYERGIPTITYELLRGDSKENILSGNIPVIEETMEYFDNKFKGW